MGMEIFILHKAITGPFVDTPDSKVHRANMEPIWGRQDPGGPHVGPVNFAIWDITCEIQILNKSMVENWGNTLLSNYSNIS